MRTKENLHPPSGFTGEDRRSQRRLRLVLVVSLLPLLHLAPNRAAAQDLPSPPSNPQLVKSGSLVIPMDNAKQSLVSPFNIKAYGLVHDLLENGIPVRWAIASGKAKDGIDFTVEAKRVAPSAIGPAVLDFSGGPFIVERGYADEAMTRVTAFGNNVAVYELTQDVTVDIRYELVVRVRPFVNSTNSHLVTDILDAAGIPDYTVNDDFSLLSGSCYTIAIEPHQTTTAGVTAIRAFLQDGGNFLAQCASVTTYENDVNGRFLTTLGIVGNDVTGTFTYNNPELSFSQFVGALEPAPGGSEEDWNLLSGSVFQNSGHAHVENHGETPASYAAMVGKLYGGQGGLVFYLGGHDWSSPASLEEVNGQRMILNAVMTPPTRPLSCGLSIWTPDLTIWKSHTGDFTEGVNGTYTLTVSNSGTHTTVDTIMVVDTLPAGLTFVSASGTGWAVDTVGQVVTATYPNSLVASGNASFQIVVAVGAGAVPSVTNRAHVSGGGEVNTANNTAVDPTDVNPSSGDVTAPAAITDLAIGAVTNTTIEITWTAPGDDGITGTASTYDIRYSTSPITDVNWGSATPATGEPAPQLAGSAESFVVTGLDPGTLYHFAIKTSDEVPNESGLSNVPSGSATDDASISSAAAQEFTVADPVTAISTITITDAVGTPTITVANDIRVRIPAGFNMSWDTGDLTAIIGGAAASNVSGTVSYEDGGKTLVVHVTTDFTTGDQITVSDLSFTSFTAVSAVDNLELEVGDNGVVTATDDETIAIGAPSLSSAANQAFEIGDPPTAASTITVTDDAASPTIAAADDIRIRIPAGFNMTWDTGDLAATISGSAASKVSGTVSYEGNRTLVLDVTADFVAGDQITIADLSFTNFTALSAADNLELVVAGAAGPTAATDGRSIVVFGPLDISSAANQIFTVGDPATLISPITITDDGVTPTIKKKKELRIRIPAGSNMTWDASVTTVTLGGSAASKVSTILRPYEDGNKTAVIDVSTDFAAGNQIIISNLRFANFNTPSSADNLELEINNDDVVSTTDDKTVTVVVGSAVSISSVADQAFNVDHAAAANGQITISDASTPVITAADSIRIRIPATFNMTWDTGDLTATIGGIAAAKVSGSVSYEDGGRTLVLGVSSDFVSGDYITVSDLSFDNFTAISPADHLELDIDNDGTADAADDKTITVIDRYGLSSAANQIFTVGDPATLISPITITDDAVTPTIKKKKELRIRIPAGSNMTWDASVTTVTLGGSAASKVSTTLKPYEDGNKTLVLDLTADFAAGDQLVVSDVKFANFSLASPADSLGMDVDNDAAADAFDDKTITITTQTYAVGVTPDTTATSRLPSNGTNYTVDFTVVNNGDGSDDFDLLITQSPGTAISVDSITGTGVTQGANPDSARVANLAASGSAVVTVAYSVADVAAGTTDTLFLTARSVGDPTVSDDGRLELTVIKPNMTTAKGVSPSGTQLPGTDLTYTITITNDGSDDAVGVVIVDSLAVEVEFQVGSVVNNLPTGVTATVEYSNDGGSTWTYTPVSAGCGAPTTYDGCVTHVRWTLQNNLSSVGPDNTGAVQLVARIQ